MVSEIVSFHYSIPTHKIIDDLFLVAGPASVIGIGGDHSNLSNEKDQYDHVMSPFHRKFAIEFFVEHSFVRFFL
jgi:hypothetical protein